MANRALIPGINPNAHKFRNAIVSCGGRLFFALDGGEYVAFLDTSLIAKRGDERDIVDLFLPPGSPARGGNGLSRPSNYSVRIVKLAPILRENEYIRLVSDDERPGIIIARKKDALVLSSLDDEVVQVYNNPREVENTVSLSTFTQNASVVLKALSQGAEGRVVDVVVDENNVFSLARYADYLIFAKEGLEFFDVRTDGSNALHADNTLSHYLDNIDENRYGILRDPSSGQEFVVVRNTDATFDLEDDMDAPDSDSADLDPEGYVRRLNCITSGEFFNDPLTSLREVSDLGIPHAICGEDGQTLIVLMPASACEEILEAEPDPQYIYEAVFSDLAERYIDDIQNTNSIVFIADFDVGDDGNQKAKGNEVPIGIILPPSAEEAVANTLSRDDIQLVQASDNEPDNEPDEQQATEHFYRSRTVKNMPVNPADLRTRLRDGELTILSNTERGVGIFIPQSIVDQIPEQFARIDVTQNQFITKKMQDQNLCQAAENTAFYNISVSTSRWETVDSKSPQKQPFGYISWELAIELEKAGHLPEIPADLKVEASREFGKIQRRQEAEAKRVAVETEAGANQEPPSKPVPPHNVTADGNASVSLAAEGAKRLVVQGGSIVANLAALKASRALEALAASVKTIRTQLKEVDSLIPVQIGDHKIYVTSHTEFVATASDIAEAFDLAHTVAYITDAAESDPIAKQWASLFNEASQHLKQLTIVHDNDLGKAVVIIPDNTEFIESDLPQLGIRLE